MLTNRKHPGARNGRGRCDHLYKMAPALVLILLFFFFVAFFTGGLEKSEDALAVCILFTGLFAGAVGVLFLRASEKTAGQSEYAWLVMSLLVAAALFVRVACLDQRTNDYDAFLSHWVEYLRARGGFAAIASIPSDYNVPYLYLLAGVSAAPFFSLYLIKFVSVVADVLLAFAAAALVKELNLGPDRRLLVMTITLFLPTFWLNSAYWAQCDGIYTLFLAHSLLALLRDKPILAMVMAGVAVSFKLQAVFFFPLLLLSLLGRRLKMRHILAIPSTFLLVCMPSLILGRPFASLFSVYGTQVDEYSRFLSLNAPSLLSILPDEAPLRPFFFAGIGLAGALILLIIHWGVERSAALSKETMLNLALLFCLGLPWLLPSMHERYFYAAEFFSILYAVMRPKRVGIAILIVLGSYSGYHAYLFGRHLLPSGLLFPTLGLGAALALLLRDLTMARALESGRRPRATGAPLARSDDGTGGRE